MASYAEQKCGTQRTLVGRSHCAQRHLFCRVARGQQPGGGAGAERFRASVRQGVAVTHARCYCLTTLHQDQRS